jgi:hypothetical protein
LRRVNPVTTSLWHVFLPRFSVRARLCPIWLAAACLCGLANAAERPVTPAIVLAPAKTPQAWFEVRGLRPHFLEVLRTARQDDPRWPQSFSVHVVTKTTADQPAMLGTYETTADCVRFRPRFPLERGIEYRAVFAWPIGGGSQNSGSASGTPIRLVQTFAIPILRVGPPARVTAIYPSARELPENLLRLYIQFSAPMSQGDAYRHVHLRDETTGTEVERPFLELPQELWSPGGMRLTLLLEPGRVKQGLVPREELGPILISGRKYTLTIDASWLDAEGRPLGEAGRKEFQAVKAESKQLDAHSWTVAAPPAGSREPLSIRFPKPLDRAMLERVLRVRHLDTTKASTTGSAELAGTVRVVDEETRWTFEPREPWSAGRYALTVSTRLEDPAGNSIGRPFEVDLKRSPPLPPAPPVVQIEFDVRGRP